jgi:hypothetical protein
MMASPEDLLIWRDSIDLFYATALAYAKISWELSFWPSSLSRNSTFMSVESPLELVGD